ncbi:rifin PIR protein, putative [Plasmodium reichenowi]|uniref:Rifin PIR protein, putative n=1 Tax=Plasmodium reichenowi TaxID=5854 RepID=A0A2P9DCF0_PLARE|nr:rifin PIR protein, putative [Plasmodium reichenowi]
MKVHHINILLFALSLNILANNKNKPQTTPYIPKIPTNRSLCECELYAPVNYDNNPQMKEVMENFNKQTQQRFHEYDERIQEKRKKCKDKCDKEIQKIILKDKLEKELMDKLAALETDIQNDAITTCVCEKSMVDKVEKGCLRCGYGLGTVAPTVGLIGSVAIGAWKNVALDVATKAAIAAGKAAGEAAGLKAGKDIVIFGLETFGIDRLCPDIFKSFQTTRPYTDISGIPHLVHQQYKETCSASASGITQTMCDEIGPKLGLVNPKGPPPPPDTNPIVPRLNALAEKAELTATNQAAKVASTKTTEFTTKNIAEVEAATTPYYTPIIASIIAIEVIVLIMVIIYLILRYRRKKKMKKKLQYIKLLEE